MKIKMHNLKRTLYAVAAFTFVLAGIFQALPADHAYAFPTGGQLVNREITITSSVQGATATYRVAFLPASDYTVEGIIVEFCDQSESPIVGDSTCAGPTGFDIGTPTVDTSPGETALGYDDLDAVNTWTASALTTHTLKIESATGPALNDTNANRYAFTISGVTNPTDLGTFYARIITYTSDSGDIDSYAPGTEGSTDAEDYGGIALSTALAINIQARVRESLTFCVSDTNPDPNCANTTTPNLLMNNGSEDIVDATGVSTADAFIQASTNAQSGVTVRMKNEGTCTGLLRVGAAGCEIHAIGETVGTTTDDLLAAVSPDGLFGMYVTDGGGSLAAVAPYNSSGDYAMDGTATGVSSTYGDIITASSTQLDSVENTLNFGARASNTTPAGLYNATLIITATGTF